MKEKYYDFFNDMTIEGRWYLSPPMIDKPYDFDIWYYSHGRKIDIIQGLKIPIYKNGFPLDITFTALGPIIVAKKRIGEIISTIAPEDIQRTPVEIEGIKDEYEVISCIHEIDCIDEYRSEGFSWEYDENDKSKIIKAHCLGKLKIYYEKVKYYDIFRIKYYRVQIIVSETIKLALESEGFTGMSFTEVT